jgi:chromosome partitioning protein
MKPDVPRELHRILVLNPKGGSGKTTVATNLASIYALRKPPPTLIDCDPQGFCMRWLEKRAAHPSVIHGVSAPDARPADVLSGDLEIPSESRQLIFDLPAAIPLDSLYAYTHLADSILIPITPSSIDVHAATRLIAELLLDVQLDRRENKVGIIANRVKSNTKSFQMLKRFFASLEIPVISVLRDSQSYVAASGAGIGICEMPLYRVRDELIAWKAILAWLDNRETAIQEEAREVSDAYAIEAELMGYRDEMLS